MIHKILLYSISILIVIFYVLYIGLPKVFSLEKYPDYCVGRVICTRALIIITKSLCYIFGFYIVYVAFGLFGWFLLLLFVFSKWLLIIPIIVSLSALLLYHSWEELCFTVLMILPFCYYLQIQRSKEC